MTNRWLIVVGALIVQLCLGAIYAWSVFVNPLKEDFGLSTTETQIIFSLGLASFAATMIFAGRWQDRKGPRIVATLGGAILGAGYILGSLSGGSFSLLALSVGVIGGAGIGLGYVCPIAACVKWFPDKRGLVTGLAVAGFGAGAWVFAKLGEIFIESSGVLNAFLYLGFIFLLTVVIGAQLLKNPPQGWKPDGWNPPKKDNAKRKEDFEWREILKTRQFWMIWIMFVFGATAGLMVVGILKPFGEFSGLSAITAGSAVGILALFNGGGRIAWGALSDRIGRDKSMSLMFALQGVMMLILMSMGSGELTLAVAAAWIGFNFGGNFALFPSATADYFGTKNLGINYGLVFTSYGVAGIIGPILGGQVFDLTGSYLWAFIPAGVMCLVAAGLAFLLKSPQHNH
ncbi:MAG: OFA family MFS transporter [Candidatus Altiarchaeota archaeon]|nr:OFA family MFS transporter [Candidatus Altiarchaeota archaeon]